MSNSAQTPVGNRIAALLDENSFVGAGAYITAGSTGLNVTEQETPADGVITGYGTISGCLVYAYSQDASVLSGSVSGMYVRKICNIYSMAMEMGAPIIGLVDCAGLRLQEAADALDGFGKLYLSQTMAPDVIPQIAATFGTCGDGMATSAGITDFIFMEEKSSKLLVNSPNAIDGNYKEKCDAFSADSQNRESGLVDLTGDENSITAQIRVLASILPANNEDDMPHEEYQDDLSRICDNIEGCTGDTALVPTLIPDNSFFMEVKRDYESSMVTGFICLDGTAIGYVVNCTETYENGEKKETFEPALSDKGRDKAANPINFCNAFNIPALTLVNVKGYKVKTCSERRIAKAAARFIHAYTDASVLKVIVIVKEALESAYLTMGSKFIGVDVVHAWLDAVIGMMDPFEAVRIMYAKETAASGDAAALINEKTAEYTALQFSAVATAKRGHVDDIIKAGETRQRIIAASEMLLTKREDRSSRKHGTV